jgi:hypothetical protein
MFNKFHLAGLVAVAAATSGFVVAPAKAACLSSSSVTTCATFTNPGSAFQEVVDSAYTDTQFVANTRLEQIKFTQNGGFTGLPIVLTDIQYFNGTSWTTTGLSSTSYNVTAISALLATNLLTGGPITFDQSLFQLRYTISANPSLTGVTGAAFESYALNAASNGATQQSQTRTHELVATPPTTATPSPLPIFGASAAFGFSRRLRKQIKSFA